MEAIQFILVVLVASMFCGTYLLSVRMKRNPLDSGEVDRLADAVDSLTDQVERLTIETADLQDRVDFAERVLAPPQEVREPTPV